MSEMEYNKGILYLVSSDIGQYAENVVKEPVKELSGGLEVYFTAYYTKEDYFRDHCEELYGVTIVGDGVYKVIFMVEGGELDQINNVVKLTQGVYSFETYHYNGGGSWREVIQGKMSKLINKQEETI